MNKQDLKNFIAQYIKANGNKEITGPILQNVLKETVDSLSQVAVSTSFSSGSPIATITVDGTASVIYAPSGSDPAGDYPTKTEVTNSINAATSSVKQWADNKFITGSLNDYAKSVNVTASINEATASTKTWVEEQGYIKGSGSIEGYAKSVDVTASINATSQSVKNWVSDQGYVSDTSSLAKSVDVTSSINNATQSVKQWANGRFITEHQSLVDYAKSSDVTSSINATSQSIKTWANGRFITEHQSLSEYAKSSDVTGSISAATQSTKQWVNEQGFLTEHQSLTAYAKSSDVSESISAISASIIGYTNTELAEKQRQINELAARGRYLTIWDCETGLPETDPTAGVPYAYKTGDYFLVGNVASTNYKPDGASYEGTASRVVETSAVAVNDQYLYDGSTWKLLKSAETLTTFASIGGEPTDNVKLAVSLSAKQNTINDLETIRVGSTLGATAAQPASVTASINATSQSIKTWVEEQGYISDTSSLAKSVDVTSSINATSQSVKNWVSDQNYSTVSFTSSLASGTKIGEINIDGTATNIYTSSSLPEEYIVYITQNEVTGDFELNHTVAEIKTAKETGKNIRVLALDGFELNQFLYIENVVLVYTVSNYDSETNLIGITLILDFTENTFNVDIAQGALVNTFAQITDVSGSITEAIQNVKSWVSTEGYSKVQFTQSLGSGTKIGEININGTATNIYAPQGGGEDTTLRNFLFDSQSVTITSLDCSKTNNYASINANATLAISTYPAPGRSISVTVTNTDTEASHSITIPDLLGTYDVHCNGKTSGSLVIPASGTGDMVITEMGGDLYIRTSMELAGGGTPGTTNYNDLTNKPQINNVELTGNKSLADLGITNTDTDLRNFLFNASSQTISSINPSVSNITSTISADATLNLSTDIADGRSINIVVANNSTAHTVTIPTTLSGKTNIINGFNTAINLNLAANEYGEIAITRLGNTYYTRTSIVGVGTISDVQLAGVSVVSSGIANIVPQTTLTAQSTDGQVPSAKCVYDLVGNVEAALAALR